MSGIAGNVVQAREISGGIHFHPEDTAMVPTPRQLPATITDFTGRAIDLAALNALKPDRVAGQSSSTVITIDGSAGIGKTTLAVHWAHSVRDSFPDGTLYANLRGYGPGHPAAPEEVLQAFLRALGIPSNGIPPSLDARAALYRSLLDERRVLVVLDNANASDQVRFLLPAGTGCLTLVTSRSNLAGLAISHAAARVSLDLLPEIEAVTLLRGIVGEARDNAEPGALAEIARACTRLPLALRIAGQRAASRPHLLLADITSALADQERRLDELSNTGDELTAVRPVFSYSYRALPPTQARTFRLLGLHPGTEIDLYAAAALTDTDPARARHTLDALADVHLVEPSSRDRYRVHDLLRAYAREQTGRQDAENDRHAALKRLLGFYLHTNDAAFAGVSWRTALDAAPTPRFRPALDTELEKWDWRSTENANLFAAARQAIDAGMHALAWQLAVTVGSLDLGMPADWFAAIGQAGLEAARAVGHRAGEVLLMVQISSELVRHQRVEEAADYARQALKVAQLAGDPRSEVLALGSLAGAARATRQPEAAFTWLQRAWEICRRLGDEWAAAVSANGLAEIYRDLGRFDEAAAHHRQALTVFRRTGDRSRESWALRGLGEVSRRLERTDEAIDLYRQALHIARQSHRVRNAAEALDGLASILQDNGEAESAIEHWREALTLYDRIGDPRAHDIRARITPT